MKKFLISLIVLLSVTNSVFAAKIPDGVQSFIKKSFPTADIRFDGVIILPDGTLYLPLYPSSMKNPDKLTAKITYPANTDFKKEPDVVIFNNDFSLLKITIGANGVKTVKHFDKLPQEIKAGLLPQDMLIPKNLVLPENMKGIVGNLEIKLEPEKEIKVQAENIDYEKTITPVVTKPVKTINWVSNVPQLRDKTLYLATCYSKNIQVVRGEAKKASYALAEKSIPRDIKITPNNKFLLVTAYNSTLVDVISLADDRIIKQLDLTTDGGEIVIDSKKNIAYISSPNESYIYQIALSTMTLTKKIKINGMCERLTLNNGCIVYADKLTNRIWSLEIDNDYTLKDLGSYPNISKLLYSDGKIYLTSRTKNRIAIINYKDATLISEFATVQKPVDMMIYNKALFVVGAQDNIVQVIDTNTNEPVVNINLGTNGFSTGIFKVPNSSLALVSDTKAGKYSVIDMGKKQLIRTNLLDIPVSNIVIAKNIRKI